MHGVGLVKWDTIAYEEFHRSYQLQSGMYLLDRLAFVCDLNGMRAADLGCGTGSLTAALAEKTVEVVTGIDSDPSMLEICRQIYPGIYPVHADLNAWIVNTEQRYDLLFSNAALHWVTDNEGFAGFLRSCCRIHRANGCIAFRFSLQENALEIKSFLAGALREFHSADDGAVVPQSDLIYPDVLAAVSDCGMQVLHAEEMRFTPFDDPVMDFQFMLQSQPIRHMFTERSYTEFAGFLKEKWGRNPIRLRSHHALVIARKSG